MITIIIGKMCSGKSTLEKEMIKQGYKRLVQTTTRPNRPNESKDEYEFVNNSMFKWLINYDCLIEYREYDTVYGKWYYGYKKRKLELDNNYVCVGTVDMCKKFIEYYGEDNIDIIYLDVDDKELERRARGRGDWDEREWERRRGRDEKDFSEERLKEIGIILKK